MLNNMVVLLRIQPPSGGCELKLYVYVTVYSAKFQPPSGGCELKRYHVARKETPNIQPPSGGCELKRLMQKAQERATFPAAFGRL